MAAPQTYIHDIPSIHGTNPALPPVLGQVDLNQALFAGNVIAQQDLSHAKAVAKALKGIKGNIPGQVFHLRMLSDTQSLEITHWSLMP